MKNAIWALAFVGLVACCVYEDTHRQPITPHPIDEVFAEYMREKKKIELEAYRCKKLGQCDTAKEVR